MSLVFYKGPNLSGRSKALQEFASQDADLGPFGQYLAPFHSANHTGLAATVGGEFKLHLNAKGKSADGMEAFIDPLIEGVSMKETIEALSGGESARMILANALAIGPHRIAIDCILEQLDVATRGIVVNRILRPLSRELEMHLADNYWDDILPVADEEYHFSANSETPKLSENLNSLTEKVLTHTCEAPTLELQDLSFLYSGSRRQIFKGASFKFGAGIVHLLNAPNGAGKSTLARLLAGVLSPQSGCLLLNGKSHEPYKSYKNSFFYCFQNPFDQIFGQSVERYLNLINQIGLKRPTYLQEPPELTVYDVIEGLGLSSFKDSSPFELPFVVAKRLTIGAALLSRSPWLFFDEPALGSDPQNRELLVQHIAGLARSGLGVIVVTHGNEFNNISPVQMITIDGRRILMRDMDD